MGERSLKIVERFIKEGDDNRNSLGVRGEHIHVQMGVACRGV